MVFSVDHRIESSSIWICDGRLSSVYIKNDSQFPWFILVPRVENITEIFQLSAEDRLVLMEDIANISRLVDDVYNPDKINVGALGNMVSQLHIHIVGRFEGDAAWPHGVWHSSCKAVPYDRDEIKTLVASWQVRLVLF